MIASRRSAPVHLQTVASPRCFFALLFRIHVLYFSYCLCFSASTHSLTLWIPLPRPHNPKCFIVALLLLLLRLPPLSSLSMRPFASLDLVFSFFLLYLQESKWSSVFLRGHAKLICLMECGDCFKCIVPACVRRETLLYVSTHSLRR